MNASLLTALRDASGPARQAGENIWEQNFCFAPGFVGFAGHFPQKPVLPAAVQIAMIRLLWSESVGPADALEIVSAKYMAPILPGERLLARLSAAPAPAGASASADRGTAEIFVLDEAPDNAPGHAPDNAPGHARPRLVSTMRVRPLRLED